jgi:hypothetical protein
LPWTKAKKVVYKGLAGIMGERKGYTTEDFSKLQFWKWLNCKKVKILMDVLEGGQSGAVPEQLLK